MNFIDLKDLTEFEKFLSWYTTKEEYKWIPVMMADRVNVKSQSDELIAYKTYEIKDSEPVDVFKAEERLWIEFSSYGVNKWKSKLVINTNLHLIQ
ncbi:hypothetical protein [Niallia taxi]|uniref:hypothetical protein n=1 Tax=Niallia taxi TaxID=2499688 RepID=UPI003008A97D